MDRFVNHQNLESLRRLASIGISEAERRMLLSSLAAEKVKFNEQQITAGAAPADGR
jgi:hypothetical protein